MKYDAILKGEINGQEILVSGSGTINEGLTIGSYQLLSIPTNFNPLILKGALVTGYPNACLSVDGSNNIFKGNSYSYERELIFNNGGKLEMTAQCDIAGENLNSIFIIKGNLECGELLDSEPIIEIWEPIADNKLSGLFRITWKARNNQYLSADAYSKYRPKNIVEDQLILHRYIEITAIVENDILSLRQDSKLFHRLTEF